MFVRATPPGITPIVRSVLLTATLDQLDPVAVWMVAHVSRTLLHAEPDQESYGGSDRQRLGVVRRSGDCALDDRPKPLAYVGGDWCERVVADDRQHPFGVDGSDVRCAVALVDDDVAG